MFRVFCKSNLTISQVKCETGKRETRKVTKLKDNFVIGPKGLKSPNVKRFEAKKEIKESVFINRRSYGA